MNIVYSNDTVMPVSDEIYDKMKLAAECAASEEQVSVPCSLSITVVTDDEIKAVNKRYRHCDSATDVLSFPQYESVGEINAQEPPIIIGDIVISIETATRQAEEYGHGLLRELVFLTVHGMLHLLGHDHLTEAEEIAMFAKQNAILASLGVNRD